MRFALLNDGACALASDPAPGLDATDGSINIKPLQGGRNPRTRVSRAVLEGLWGDMNVQSTYPAGRGASDLLLELNLDE